MSQIIEIFSYLGEYRKRIWLVFVLAFVNTAGSVGMTYIMARMIDIGIAGRNTAYIFRTGALLLVVALITCVSGTLNKKNVGTISSGTGDHLRMAMMDKLLEFSSVEVDHLTKASIISRMTEDVVNIQKMIVALLGTILSAPIMTVLIFIASYRINKSLSLFFLLFVPIFAVLMYFIVTRAIPHFAQNALHKDIVNGEVFEALVNIRLIKGFVREKFVSGMFRSASENTKNSGLQAEQITNVNYPMQQLMVDACIILILWFGGQKIMAGSLKVGELFSLITYTNQILYQIVLVATFIMPVVSAFVSVRRVLEMIHTEPSVQDLYAESAAPDEGTDGEANERTAEETGEKARCPESGSVIFDHVSFDFNGSSDDRDKLLKNINFEIHDRELIGIVGATGSGKSVLVQLIPRLFDVTEGRILIGGRSICSMSLYDLRKQIAFALQKSMLFSGTIRENLLFGDPDAGEEDMIRACREACIYDFVTSHEEGFDYQIEEGGRNLSGGQRQRMCLAAAFIKKSSILIMDDCTSALDKATEREITDHIVNDFTDRTRIFVSGKISSVMRADRILLLEKGRIAGIGTHEQLFQQNEIYRGICLSQGVEE